MDRNDLDELEKQITKEVVKRRSLGGYSQEAEGLLILSEAMMLVVRHLKEKAPRTK